jgi:hypothetical protein
MVAALGAGGAWGAGGQDERLQALVECVRAREQRVVSAELTYRLVELGGRGTPVPGFAVVEERLRLAPDAMAAAQVRLVVSGDKVRLDKRTAAGGAAARGARGDMTWSRGAGVMVTHNVPAKHASVMSGTACLWRPAASCVLQAYRLLSPGTFGIQPGDLQLVGSERFGGHDCSVVEYRRRGGRPDYYSQYWFAEDMGCCLVRVQVYDRRGLLLEKTLDYAPDEEIGWRLVDWQHAQDDLWLAPRELESTFNRPIAEERFAVEFPPGTFVSDGIRGREYVVAEETPKLEGLLRQGRMAEFVARAQEEMGEEGRASRWPWYVAGGAAVAAAAVGGGRLPAAPEEAPVSARPTGTVPEGDPPQGPGGGWLAWSWRWLRSPRYRARRRLPPERRRPTTCAARRA